MPTARELLSMDVEPPHYSIPELMPEGLVMLAGQPKAGKSFSALDAAVSVAMGEPFLGFEIPTKRDVLYLALEDGAHRIKARMMRRLHIGTEDDETDDADKDRLDFQLDWSSAAEGGFEELESYLADVPNLGMIVIDTLAKFQPVDGSYNRAYPALTKLSKFGREHHVTILAVHHAYRGLRSGGHKPAIESIQGSIGASAAADAIMVLARDPDADTGVLMVTGKDVESQNIPLAWNKNGGGWVRQGVDAEEEKARATMTQRVLLYLIENPMSDCKSVCRDLDAPYQSVRRTMDRLRQTGKVTRENGLYAMAQETENAAS